MQKPFERQSGVRERVVSRAPALALLVARAVAVALPRSPNVRLRAFAARRGIHARARASLVGAADQLRTRTRVAVVVHEALHTGVAQYPGVSRYPSVSR